MHNYLSYFIFEKTMLYLFVVFSFASEINQFKQFELVGFISLFLDIPSPSLPLAGRGSGRQGVRTCFSRSFLKGFLWELEKSAQEWSFTLKLASTHH